MQTILRIQDRFNITGRGIVYAVKNEILICNICINDILYDLHGNKFKIKEINGFRHRYMEERKCNELGIMLENLDGVAVRGNILLSSTKINWIYCNHPLYQYEPDEDYLDEYNAYKEKKQSALFSYNDLECGALSLYGDEISGLTIYRGWMMKPEMYTFFYEKLKEKNIVLINLPNEYIKYHQLPDWYYDFEEYTAKSYWIFENNLQETYKLLHKFNSSVIVKDFVKSRKHEWYDACFIKDVNDINNAKQVIQNFIDRQGDDLVGGVVLREFLDLNQIGYHEQSKMPISEEYRVFIYGGRILCIGNYWNEKQQGMLSDEESEMIQKLALQIKSNFVTMDLARCKDNTLKIMELGDGQVSGLQKINSMDFYSQLT